MECLPKRGRVGVGECWKDIPLYGYISKKASRRWCYPLATVMCEVAWNIPSSRLKKTVFPPQLSWELVKNAASQMTCQAKENARSRIALMTQTVVQWTSSLILA